MRISFILLLLTLLSFHSNANVIDGTREFPTVIECDTCITNSEYEQKVNRTLKPHESKYFLVINNKTRQVRTYWGYDITEREIGIFFREVYQVSNLAKHEEQFQDHLVWIAASRPKKPTVFEYPPKASGGHCCFSSDLGAHYANWARGELQKVDIFYAGKIYIVTIKFENNYNVVMELTPYSQSYAILAIIAPDGSLVPTTSAGNGGGSSSSSQTTVNSITFSNVNVGGRSLMCSFSDNNLHCKWV